MNSLPYESSTAIDWPVALDENASWIRKVVHARLHTVTDVDDVVQDIATAVLKVPPCTA